MFCDEPGCDCRRVMFSVASNRSNKILAVIAYGWETPEFYTNWLNDNDPNLLAETIGPTLNTASPTITICTDSIRLIKKNATSR